ncbi:MAG: DUF3568 family protein [Phycisphaeraceae bacterium]|nr:DUF3568 family protein [Phycisphaeraceae bacterium]
MNRSNPIRRPGSGPTIAACVAGLAACAVAPFALPACTGLEPAAISAGASAAQTGATVFTQGKLTTFEPVEFHEAVESLRIAADRLNLQLRIDEPGEGDETDRRIRLVYDDERKQSFVVVIQRRTATITRISVDVGTYGPVGMANLLILEMIDELRSRGAYDRVKGRSGAD